MAGNNNFRPAPRKKNALDEYKLRLNGPVLADQGAKFPGALAVSVVKNQIHLDVYTNVPNDKNNGNIRAAMDQITFGAFLELFDAVLKSPADTAYKITNKNHTFFEGKRSEEPRLVSTTILGRDKEGVMFIALVAKDRPYLKFDFLGTSYHAIMGPDGNPLSKAEASNFFARGWRRTITGLVAAVATAEYVAPEPKNKDGGGNSGGGYNGGGNRNGGGNSNGGGGYNGGGNRSGGGGAPSGGNGDWGNDDDYNM